MTTKKKITHWKPMAVTYREILRDIVIARSDPGWRRNQHRISVRNENDKVMLELLDQP